jgi:VIT1/CCC1 family predicted Fe2+/Mn2+ transporter
LVEEQAELDANFPREHRELTAIYVRRGLDLPLAKQVAEKLMAHDALSAHARDELGISKVTASRYGHLRTPEARKAVRHKNSLRRVPSGDNCESVPRSNP